MSLLDGTIDHAAGQLRQIADPLFKEFENRMEKIVNDTLDRIDGAVVTFDITVRLPKKAEPET